MEPNQLINDDLLNSSPLEHHGVKGMKWGVWNAETRAKYIGGSGRKLSKGVKQRSISATGKIAKLAGKKVSEIKSSHASKKQEKADERAAKKQSRKDIAQQRKELGMTRVEYSKLRETTLKSHDPKVVAKGMHTLTDMELDQKLDRLKKEDQINRLSSDQATRRHNEHKARSEAIKANPLYGIGMNVAGRAIKKVSNGLVNPVPTNDGPGAKATGKSNDEKKSKESKSSDSAKETSNEPSNTAAKTYGSSAKPKTVSTEKGGSGRVNTRSLPGIGTYETPTRMASPKALSETSSYESMKANSSQAKAAAKKGKSWVDDNVIDVTPIEASSTRYGKQK